MPEKTESRTIQTIKDIRDLLASYDDYRQEVERLEGIHVEPELPAEPDLEEVPETPKELAAPKRGAFGYIVLVLAVLAAGGVWYYGTTVGQNYLVYGIGVAGAGLIIFIASAISHSRAVKRFKESYDADLKKYQEDCERIEAENAEKVKKYEAEVKLAENEAAEANAMNEVKLNRAKTAMSDLQDIYMEKYAKLIYPECCNVESLDRMIELLESGEARTIKVANLRVRAEQEVENRLKNGDEELPETAA